MAIRNPISQILDGEANVVGLPAQLLHSLARIESGGKPNARTGSYKGLFQLSNKEFNKYGGGNIYDAKDNAMAAAKKLASESKTFENKYGRQPSSG